MPVIGDLVELPPIKTVIQLKDLEDPDLSRMILETFVVTDEVEQNLGTVMASLASGQGCGVFLKGHFGSGKSHFLSMVSLLLRQESARDALADQSAALSAVAAKLRHRGPLVVEISLVEHRESEFLEDIFLNEAFVRLAQMGAGLPEGLEGRKDTFAALAKAVADRGLSGIAFLVDELSEFLKSKTDAHAYNEDIRFLQYLGETAEGFPLWIIACLQEWIEETGQIDQDAFNKIKDRYRIRLSLGRAHIEELVSSRLIRHKPGVDETIRRLFAGVREYFPSFPVDESRFVRLYPVHPATSTLLDRVKPLFSEHRGVIDFIHYRLKGDPLRDIPGFLDRPVEDLLTPDTLFDHFYDRIREMSETQVFAEKVYQYYREEIPDLFPDPERREKALAAIKLLILFAISPVRRDYKVRHVAEMLLYRVSRLEPQINYQYMRDILERLSKYGSYVTLAPGETPLDDVVRINLHADMGGILRTRVRHKMAGLHSDDSRLFGKLAPMAHTTHLPLGGWVALESVRLSFSWQSTHRTGRLFVRQLDECSVTFLETLAAEERLQEEDYFVLVGTTHRPERQVQHLTERLLPVARERFPGLFLFWVPAPLKETQRLKELLAMVLIREGYSSSREELSDNDRKALSLLGHWLEEAKKDVGDAFTDAYFSGALYRDQHRIELAPYGHLSPGKFLDEFARPLLEQRFLRHNRIQPFLEALPPTAIEQLTSRFLHPGVVDITDKSQFGLRSLLEGVLKSMGLVKKQGNRYLLHVHPGRNELVDALLTHVAGSGPTSFENLYWLLRKGDYGLMRPQFEILVLALVFSGHLVAFRHARRKGTEDILRTALEGVTALGRGEMISEAARRILKELPLIPERFRKADLTLPLQEDLWHDLTSGKQARLEWIEGLSAQIARLRGFSAFRRLAWDTLAEDLDKLAALWKEVKTSLSSGEGLERFVDACSKEPFLDEKVERVGKLGSFMERAEAILSAYRYCSDPRLAPPQDQEAWKELAKRKKEILETFERPDAFFPAEQADRFLAAFNDFRDAYARAYLEGHRRVREAEVFAPYENLRRSKRYHLLARIDTLNLVSVEEDKQSIDRELSAALAQQCGRATRETLRVEPVCTCGYLPGQETVLVSIGTLEQRIDRAIVEGLRVLRSPLYMERIGPHLADLESIGKKDRAEAIRGLLSAAESGAEGVVESLEQALKPAVLEGIREAVSGKILVVQRNLDRLYGALVNKKYTKARLMEIVGEWLGEQDVGGDTYIHFQGTLAAGSLPDEARRLEDFLKRAFPHLLPHMEHLGFHGFLQGLLGLVWARSHGMEGQPADAPERDKLTAEQMLMAARDLRGTEPGLFDRLAETAQSDGEWMEALWSRAAALSCRDLFTQETLFADIARRAFQRTLSDPGSVKDFAAWKEAPPKEGGAVFQTASLLRARREMEQTMAACARLREHTVRLKARKGKAPTGWAKWERLFEQTLSPIPFLEATVRSSLHGMDVQMPAWLARELAEARETASRLDREFAVYYASEMHEENEGARPCPMTIEQVVGLPSALPDLAKDHPPCFLLMDAARKDLWEYLKTEFWDRLRDRFRLVREGALWAHAPTRTAEQLVPFEQALRKDYPDAMTVDRFLKIGGIDERVHTERGGLVHLFRNVLGYLQLDWAPRLMALPAGTLLVAFADHGFAENPEFDVNDKYRNPRYVHGGTTCFEVIVPWAVFVRL